MNRTYYADYVRHAMRFYAKFPDMPATFRTDADAQNWHACHDTVSRLTQKEQSLVMDLYRDGDTIPDSIFRLSNARNISQDYLWALVKKLEREIAAERGLL